VWRLAIVLAGGPGVDSSLISAVLQSAGAGTAIIVVLLLLGILSTKGYTQRVEQDAERWFAAYEASRSEVEELRKSLAVQTSRADQAVETARHATDILERLQVSASGAAEAPQRPAHRRGG
jgi:hypothetical protein